MERPVPVPADLVERATSLAARWSDLPELVAVVLCGSAARGEMTPWSDVDFAVLCEVPLSLDDRLRIVADGTSALGRDVDVVDLLRAPLPLRGHVTRDARPLLVTDDDAWCDFVTRTTIAWLDDQPLYERAIAIELARFAGEEVA
ncbi:MAG: nucleotidyltransferase domain-containing protein [Deltaproteobacteria bacterium]|nr:nucleotidyltransferase domain-containing protein [Deltaproteobacteria bacterium]